VAFIVTFFDVGSLSQNEIPDYAPSSLSGMTQFKLGEKRHPQE